MTLPLHHHVERRAAFSKSHPQCLVRPAVEANRSRAGCQVVATSPGCCFCAAACSVSCLPPQPARPISPSRLIPRRGFPKRTNSRFEPWRAPAFEFRAEFRTREFEGVCCVLCPRRRWMGIRRTFGKLPHANFAHDFQWPSNSNLNFGGSKFKPTQFFGGQNLSAQILAPQNSS